MSAPLIPPQSPERTAAHCQSEVLRLSGDLLAVAGKFNPDPLDVQSVVNLITYAVGRWKSAHNLCHAATRKEKAS